MTENILKLWKLKSNHSLVYPQNKYFQSNNETYIVWNLRAKSWFTYNVQESRPPSRFINALFYRSFSQRTTTDCKMLEGNNGFWEKGLN